MVQANREGQRDTSIGNSMSHPTALDKVKYLKLHVAAENSHRMLA